MDRKFILRLNDVSPVPHGLREEPTVDAPANEIPVDLGRLYHHYFFDGFPSGPPSPDPSRFEYLHHLANTPDFRFLSYVSDASTTRKRSISTELGQALCRWVLDIHFEIKYFAHMSRVLGKATHSGFDGLRIERIAKGDVPDYLCARKVTNPMIAEAKGRFSSFSFNGAEFRKWRAQFDRIRARNRAGMIRTLKGYIVASRFATEEEPRVRSSLWVEDPMTPGDTEPEPFEAAFLGRTVAAFHYASVFRRLGLHLLASGLENGSGTPRELTFGVPVWTCFASPFRGRQFIGGFYQTLPGPLPALTDSGWQISPVLGAGHAVFVGLEKTIAIQVGLAARGNRESLDEVPDLIPEGGWTSEFSWLKDGTVMAPIDNFRPSGSQQL